jgi:hypothetical protein
MKSEKTNNVSGTMIAVIILIVLMEVIGCYCNIHKEEFRKKDWQQYEEYHNRMMSGNSGINWDAKN